MKALSLTVRDMVVSSIFALVMPLLFAIFFTNNPDVQLLLISLLTLLLFALLLLLLWRRGSWDALDWVDLTYILLLVLFLFLFLTTPHTGVTFLLGGFLILGALTLFIVTTVVRTRPHRQTYRQNHSKHRPQNPHGASSRAASPRGVSPRGASPRREEQVLHPPSSGREDRLEDGVSYWPDERAREEAQGDLTIEEVVPKERFYALAGSNTYHRKECRSLRNATPEEILRCSREEAAALGLRPCKVCKP